jgi:hypothetical protein
LVMVPFHFLKQHPLCSLSPMVISSHLPVVLLLVWFILD